MPWAPQTLGRTRVVVAGADRLTLLARGRTVKVCRIDETSADEIGALLPAREILADFKGQRLDWFVTGYGTGGTLRQWLCAAATMAAARAWMDAGPSIVNASVNDQMAACKAAASSAGVSTAGPLG